MGEFQSQRLDALFRAMADPTRRAILARLAISDARVTEVAGEFAISANDHQGERLSLGGMRLP
jgi:DNA-binding transcriptional ArsR family regulator